MNPDQINPISNIANLSIPQKNIQTLNKRELSPENTERDSGNLEKLLQDSFFINEKGRGGETPANPKDNEMLDSKLIVNQPSPKRQGLCKQCGVNQDLVGEMLSEAKGTENHDAAVFIIENCPTCKSYFGRGVR